jgi:hypothetical protein
MARWFLVFLALCLLVACSPASSDAGLLLPTALPSPDERPSAIEALPPPVIDESQGAIVGRIVTHPAGWAGQTVSVYLCPFYETGGSAEGFYILEPSIHPSGAATEAGDFQVLAVPPGRYAIVVGPAPEESVAVREDGRTRVVDVTAGEVLDLGELELP